MPIERVVLYQAIKTLPDNFLPELAEFIAFLQMKAQQKINVWAILSTNNGVGTKSATLQNDTLEKAAQTLFDDYIV
jgi:phosphoribosylaminoimidazole (AIR) synthetase